MIISEKGIGDAEYRKAALGRYDPGKVVPIFDFSPYSILCTTPGTGVRNVETAARLLFLHESLDEMLAKPRLGPESPASVRRPRELTPPTILSSLLCTDTGTRNQRISQSVNHRISQSLSQRISKPVEQ